MDHPNKTLPLLSKLSFLLLIATLFSSALYATTFTINSVDEFNALNLSAGDIVIWEDGTYSDDERIVFSGNGTATNPITLKAETPGGVVFNNGLQMNIAGDYLIVEGFYWKGGYGASNFIQFRNGTTYAQNCTLQNCAIDGLEVSPDDIEAGTSVKHRWVVLYGNFNKVLNCSFMNKSNAGAIVLVELEYNAEADRCAIVGHTISNNYFYNYEKTDASLTNAGDSETIRVGTSEYQNVDCRTTVSNNYFVSADGENEIITNKSDNNVYVNNTFRRCRGSLVLRHGSGATVDGNYFLGENVEGTGGIRIVDSDHRISNNYIQDCINVMAQAKWNNGITFMGGGDNSQDNCSATNVSNGYQESEDIVLSNNTIVNTNAPLFYNINKGSNSITGTVANNLIYFENGTSNLSEVLSGDASNSYLAIGASLSYSGNIYDGANLGASAPGFSSTSLTASSNGEIFNFLGAGSAGANMGAYLPTTDSMVGDGMGACFLNADGSLSTDCSGVIITPPTDNLLVSTLSQFTATSESKSLTITANINWTVTNNNAWFSVSPTSGSNNGTTTVSVTDNTATSPRTGTFTVAGGGITRTVTVTQARAEVIIIPTGTNLALNKPVTGTGTADGANIPSNITDGSTATRWSVSGFPKSAIIDLGDVYSLESTEVVCYQDRAYQFIMEVATNANGPYTQVIDRSNNSTSGTANSPIADALSSVNARYVRITVSGANAYTGPWVSLAEVRVFGEAITSNCPLNLTLANDILVDESYSAQATIESTQVIKNAAAINYSAGTSIILKPGFEVEAGSEFLAIINSCTSSSAFTEKESINLNNKSIAVSQESLLNHINTSLLLSPNPINEKGVLSYQLLEAKIVNLVLYDINGRQVQVLLKSKSYQSGRHESPFDVTGLEAGIYFLSLQTDKDRQVLKVVVSN